MTRTTKDTELDRTKQSHVQRQNFARKRRSREQSSSTPTLVHSSHGSESPLSVLAGPSAQVRSPFLGRDDFVFQNAENVDFEDLSALVLGPYGQHQDTVATGASTALETVFSPVSTSTAQHTPAFDFPSPYRPGHSLETPADYSVVSRQHHTPPILSPSPPSGASAGPFASTQWILEQWAPPLIAHYNTVILPELFFADTRVVPMSRMRHAPSIHADMQACMSEPAHMYAFLASASIQMLVREGRLLLPDISETDHHRVPIFFKTKAIQALRPKLANGQLDHRLAVDIHRLYATAIHADNYSAAEPHFQALETIITTLGGLHTFDDYILEKMILLHWSGAIKRLSVPRLRVTWDPGPWPAAEGDRIKVREQIHPRAGSLFQPICQVYPLGSTLAEILTDLVELLRVSTYMGHQHEYNPAHYRWLSLRRMVLGFRLLSLAMHVETDERQECLRIALIFWIALTTSPSVGRRCASKSVPALRRRLENSGTDDLWHPYTDCLLWIVVMAGLCTSDEVDREWLSKVAADAAFEIEIVDLGGLEELLHGFLYDPSTQRDDLVAFAERMWHPYERED